MFKKYLITKPFIFICILCILFGTNNNFYKIALSESNSINIEKLDESQIDNLSKLCKIWGFVKYYHPEVISGSVDWDNELFKIMPSVLEAKNPKELDNILYQWINKLGEIKQEPYENKGEIAVDARTEWINDTTYISKDLSNLLNKISKTYVTTRQNAYASIEKQWGYSNFSNEQKYNYMKYDDDNFRLLCLFRYWNIIEYYYPYRNEITENWDNVLIEFIPKFIEDDDELSYKLVVSELVSKIEDSHASVIDRSTTDSGNLDTYLGLNMAPVKFLVVENKIVITEITEKYAKESNVKVGDIVLKIDDKDIFDVIKEKSKYISFSSKEAIVNGLSYSLFSTPKNSLSLTIERDGKTIVENVKCYKNAYPYTNKESHKLLDGNIGYINPGALQMGEINSIMDKFKDTKGLIIDLRNYPSDFIVYSLGAYLMPHNVTFSKSALVNPAIPGEFIFTEDLKVGFDNPNYYKGQVTILMNECSQSQSEFTVMSFRQAPNAKVIGSRTIGADGNIVKFSLPGKIDTIITGLGIYNPDGSETQRVGLQPDILVEPTIQGIRDGKDELLEKAIEIINLSNNK